MFVRTRHASIKWKRKATEDTRSGAREAIFCISRAATATTSHASTVRVFGRRELRPVYTFPFVVRCILIYQELRHLCVHVCVCVWGGGMGSWRSLVVRVFVLLLVLLM